MFLNTCKRSVPSDQLVFFLVKPFSTWCSFPLNTMVFNITEHVQGVQYLLRFRRSDGVLNLNTHFYSVVFDLFCIFRENTHEQQLIQAKILYQCASRNILDFVYGGSHFSTGVIFLRIRHVKNRPLWHFFYTWDTFFYGQGSFLYDEKWPLGRFSTGVVIRRYTGSYVMGTVSLKIFLTFIAKIYGINIFFLLFLYFVLMFIVAENAESVNILCTSLFISHSIFVHI